MATSVQDFDLCWMKIAILCPCSVTGKKECAAGDSGINRKGLSP